MSSWKEILATTFIQLFTPRPKFCGSWSSLLWSLVTTFKQHSHHCMLINLSFPCPLHLWILMLLALASSNILFSVSCSSRRLLISFSTSSSSRLFSAVFLTSAASLSALTVSGVPSSKCGDSAAKAEEAASGVEKVTVQNGTGPEKRNKTREKINAKFWMQIGALHLLKTRSERQPARAHPLLRQECP